MKAKLTDKSIRYAVRQLTRGKTTKTVSEELGVTQRHIQRLWAEYKNAGTAHLQEKPGRPTKPLLDEEVKAVLDAHSTDPAGVLRTTRNLGSHISHRRIYRIIDPMQNKTAMCRPGTCRQNHIAATSFFKSAVPYCHVWPYQTHGLLARIV